MDVEVDLEIRTDGLYILSEPFFIRFDPFNIENSQVEGYITRIRKKGIQDFEDVVLQIGLLEFS